MERRWRAAAGSAPGAVAGLVGQDRDGRSDAVPGQPGAVRSGGVGLVGQHLVVALGGSGISKSEVSRICAGLDETVGAFRTRRLDHVEFPYVYLDATYLHVRTEHGMVTSKAVVVATGVTAQGRREILGLDVGDSEDEVFWRGFLTSLKKRGLTGVKLVISDQHAGLVAAIGRALQGTAHQRCRVHFIRNVLAHVAKGEGEMGPRKREVPPDAVFRTIFAQPKLAPMSKQWDKVRDELAARYPKIGPLMDDAKTEVLAFAAFPREHWRKIWSTNPLSSGSTRRSNAAPASWASSRTKPPSSASSEPSWPTPTTNGPPTNAATSPKHPWPSCTPTAIMAPSPPSTALTGRHRDAPQSPPLHGTPTRETRTRQASTARLGSKRCSLTSTAELVKAAERGQFEGSEGSVRHVELFRVGA